MPVGHQYNSIRISPSIQNMIADIEAKWHKKNRRWSKTAIINVALLAWLKTAEGFNDKEVEGLFEKYEAMMTGKAGLLK